MSFLGREALGYEEQNIKIKEVLAMMSTPLIPELRKQKVNLCESEASLVYIMSFRTARDI